MSRPLADAGRPMSSAHAVVVRGSVINLVAMVAGAAVSFALVVLVSRWLQPRGAGAFFQVIALFTILSNTFELGADTGLTRWISRARAIGGMENVRRMIAIAAIPVALIGAVVAVVIWLIAPELAHIFLHGLNQATEATEIRVVAPMVPLGALSAVMVAGARGFGRMWPYLVIEGLGKPLVRIVLVAGVLWAGFGLEAAIVVWSLPVAAGLVLGCLILAGVVHKEAPAGARPPGEQPPVAQVGGRTPPAGPVVSYSSAMRAAARQPENNEPGDRPRRLERPQFPVIPELDATLELPVIVDPVVPYAARTDAGDGPERGRHRGDTRLFGQETRQLAAEFWRFTGPRAVQATFQVIVLWLDILIVGALTDSYQAGIYNAVSKLAIVGTYALDATRLAIGPQLSAMLAKHQHERAAELYQSATRWLILATWPVYLIFATFPALTLGIFGPKYSAGAWALATLALAMLVNLGTGNVTVVLLMGGKSSWSAFNATGALVVNIALNLILVPRIGILGASIAWAASIIVDNVAAMIEIRWVMKLAPFGRGYLTATLITTVCFGATGVAARLLFGEIGPALGVALSAGLAGFVLALYAARSPLQLTGLAAIARPRAGPHGPVAARPAPEPLPAIAATAGAAPGAPPGIRTYDTVASRPAVTGQPAAGSRAGWPDPDWPGQDRPGQGPGATA